MKWYSKLWFWIKRYWYIPLLAVFSAITWFIYKGCQGKLPNDVIKKELRALKAEGEVKKLHAEISKEKALEAVQLEYASELAQLDEKQKQKAKELEDDPSKLAKFAIKASRN